MDNPDHSMGDLAVVALDLFIDAVATIGPQDWDKPSNLDGWTLRDLVGHATGSAGPSQPADWIADDPAARLTELTGRLRAALPGADFDAPRPSPGGEVLVGQR